MKFPKLNNQNFSMMIENASKCLSEYEPKQLKLKEGQNQSAFIHNMCLCHSTMTALFVRVPVKHGNNFHYETRVAKVKKARDFDLKAMFRIAVSITGAKLNG